MNNLFCIVENKNTSKVEAGYKQHIIRQVSQKQEAKLKSLSQNYSSKQQKLSGPRWLYIGLRIFGTLVFTSFIFLIIDLMTDLKQGGDYFMQKNLWVLILFCVSILLLIINILVLRLVKKKTNCLSNRKSAEDIFQRILDLSREYLNIPKNSISLEVLSFQVIMKNNEIKEPKHRIYSNVILQCFIEQNMLCFADIYDVIAIPLDSIKSIDYISENYSFRFWHKKESIKTYGIHLVARPIRHYEGQGYYCIKASLSKEDEEFLVPKYEMDLINNLLKGKFINDNSKSEI